MTRREYGIVVGDATTPRDDVDVFDDLDEAREALAEGERLVTRTVSAWTDVAAHRRARPGSRRHVWLQRGWDLAAGQARTAAEAAAMGIEVETASDVEVMTRQIDAHHPGVAHSIRAYLREGWHAQRRGIARGDL